MDIQTPLPRILVYQDEDCSILVDYLVFYGFKVINTSEEKLKLKFQIGQSNLKKWLQNYQYSIKDLVNKGTTELFQDYKTFCIETNCNASNKQTFVDDLLTETDLMLEFDKALRDFYVVRYDNDPRPDDYIFVPAEQMSRRNSKWG